MPELKSCPVYTAQVVNSDLWKLFPVINVDKTKDIPRDYPGAIGVPITYMDKHDPARFEIIGMVKPKINGVYKYQRIIIRNLHPDLPEIIDLAEWLNMTGSSWVLEIEDGGIDGKTTKKNHSCRAAGV